jgi:hypothetical protein
MKAETAAAMKVIAMGCTIIFLVFLGLSVPFYLRQREVLKTWPRTEAKVLAANVSTAPGKRSTYTARFLVQYRLGDSVLSTTVDSGYGDRLRSHAQAMVDRFPAGSSVTVAYNPLDATQVRLNPGYNRYFFAAPLFITEVGLVFAGIAAVLYLVARRSERAARTTVLSAP